MAATVDRLTDPGPADRVGSPPVFTKELRLVVGLVVLAATCALAGLKPLGISADLENYRGMFEWSVQTDWQDLVEATDPLYHVLSRMAAALGAEFAGFTLLVAVVTCVLKAKALAHIETDRAMLVVLYFSYLFWLHDYTQIRLGLALGFALVAMYVPSRANWLLYPIAMLTHGSTVLVVGLHWAYRRPRAAAMLLAMTALIVLITGQAENLLTTLASRVTVYLDLLDAGEFSNLNIFSSMPAIQAGILIAMWPHFSSLPRAAREEYLMSWIGTLAFYGLSFLPVLAFRLNELLMPFLLVLISRLWRQSPTVTLGALLYVASGVRTSFFSSGSLVFSGGG